MAKAVILDVLENTIGKYVLNLDPSALNVAVWKGNIELNSLLLDVDAVNADLAKHAVEAPNLALPFRVESGSFDKLSVDVPWSKLSSRAVIFRANSLHIKLELHNYLSNTSSSYKQSASEESTNKQSQREQDINDAEKARLRSNALRDLAASGDIGEGGTSNEGKGDGFGARLVRRVLENMQVEVSDIKIELHGGNCKTGAILKSLKLATTDKSGKPTFIDRTKDDHFLFKSLTIDGFGLYCDDDNSEFSIDRIASLHDYILFPLSFSASLRQSDLEKCITFPKYLFSSRLSDIDMAVSRSQAEHLKRLADDINNMRPQLRILFPEYRPLKAISPVTAKDWWKYALRCVGRLNRKRSWAEFFLAFKKRQRYVQLFKRFSYSSDCPWLLTLSEDELMELHLIENDRSISIIGIMSWRNLAESQMKLEKTKRDAKLVDRKKTQKKSLFSTFYSKPSDNLTSIVDIHEAPISLSIDEMRELDSLALGHASESLSEDSKLAEMNFVLSSLSMDFIGVKQVRLANFQLGRVGVDFAANADGSLSFGLSLHSMALSDMFTKLTKFPSIVNTLHSSKNALDFRLEKSKTGDQYVFLNLAAIELVASPGFIREMTRFVSIEAIEKVEDTQEHELVLGLSSKDDPSKDTLADAIADAWSNKSKNQQVWKVDCIIHAPIIVIPEDCWNLEANVIALDMGHFHLIYGCEPSQNIIDWFRSKNSFAPIDHLKLEMSKLALYSGSVKEKIASDQLPGSLVEIILEPMSFEVDIGLENTTSRICLQSVIPSFSLTISLEHLILVASVVLKWKDFFHDLGSSVKVDEKGSNVSDIPKAQQYSTQNRELFDEEPATKSLAATETFYGSIDLKRFSIEIIDGDDRIEAHLVSIAGSIILFDDGSIESRIRLGWFGIVDCLERGFSRKQRLLIYSELPKFFCPFPEVNNALSDKLNDEKSTKYSEVVHAMTDIPAIDFSNLANISFARNRGFYGGTKVLESNMLEITLSSLYIYWNPRVINDLMMFYSGYIDKVKNYAISIFSHDKAVPVTPSEYSKEIQKSEEVTPKKIETKSIIVLCLKSLTLTLNSAKDDLPIYIITMARTNIGVEAFCDDMSIDIEMGDLRIETQPVEKVYKPYHTILCLSTSQMTSLLSVKYFKGNSVKKSDIQHTRIKNCDACALVELSPMRMVFIQAQILTLTDYLTTGILGTITSEVASSAAAAAAEVTNAIDGEQLFVIKASSLDIVLPQAACKETFFSLGIGEVEVDYTMLPSNTGGKCDISLQNLVISSSEGSEIIDDPINARVKVYLPGGNAAAERDRAIDIEIHVPTVSLCLLKSNFLQLLNTLDENIGEKDTFFRDLLIDDFPIDEREVQISHVGSRIVEEESQLYIRVAINLLSLNLFTESEYDPLVQIRTEIAAMSMKTVPDQNRTLMELQFLNIEADDQRIKSVSHPFKRLIGRHGDTLSSTEAAITISLESCADGSKSTNVDIGATQFVLIPDLIEDLISFTDRSIPQEPMTPSEPSSNIKFQENKDGVNLKDIDNESDGKNLQSSIQQLPSFLDDSDGSAQVSQSSNKSKNYLSNKKFKISVKSTECRFLLVDMGIKIHSLSTRHSQKFKTPSLISEVLAVQGKIRADLCSAFANDGDDIFENLCELHCDRIQIFKAQGSDLKEPVQILEPVDFSLVFQQTDFGSKVTIKFVTLTKVILACSMQDLALFRAIILSITKNTNASNTHEKIGELSKQEEDQIEKLAYLLKDDKSVSITDSAASKDSFYRQSIVEIDEAGPTKSCHDNNRELKGNLTLSAISLLIINDLKGLDHALFKIGVENLLASACATIPLNIDGSSNLLRATGESQLHTSFKASYFDSASNRWEPLLLNEWEWTVNCKRYPGKLVNKLQFLQTSVDIEARPCVLKFSEQFLVSLGGANKMWSLYYSKGDSEKRSLVASTPYGIENKCGVPLFYKPQGKGDGRVCSADTIDYFRFQYPAGDGFGGMRLYGQDLTEMKSVFINVGSKDFEGSDSVFVISDIDKELYKSRSHRLKDGRVIFSEVIRTARTMLIRIRSRIQIQNCTQIPIAVVTQTARGLEDIGTCCERVTKKRKSMSSSVQYSQPDSFPSTSTSWPSLGVPLNVLLQYDSFESKTAGITLLINPIINERERSSASLTVGNQDVIGLWGVVALPPPYALKQLANTDESITTYDMSCTRVDFDGIHNSVPFVMQVSVEVSLVDEQPFVDVFLHPRLILENLLPVGIFIRSPMPYIFDQYQSGGEDSIDNEKETIHYLLAHQAIYVFTPGPSIAISFKLADAPCAGGLTGWFQGEWLDIPISRIESNTKQLGVPCLLPFIDNPGGHVILLLEGDRLPATHTQPYKLCFKPQNIAVDHTGEFVFHGCRTVTNSSGKEQRKLSSHPWSSFSERNQRKCVTLLPSISEEICIIKINDSKKRSQIFRVDEIAIGGGGLESSAILWKNTIPSGYFAYRVLENNELHIIPEYIIFNGCEFKILIKQSGYNFALDPGKMAPIKSPDNVENMSIIIMIEIPEVDAITVPVSINTLGLKLCGLQSTTRQHDDNHLIGSVAIQTVIGASDSRWVIKIGDLKLAGGILSSNPKNSLVANDFLRFRIRFSDFQITLCDSVDSAINDEFTDVIKLKFSGNLFDYQRIFKEETSTPKVIERSQVALIIDNIQATDCYKDSLFPVVLDSPFNKSLLNVLIRFRNEDQTDIMKVDLVDFNIGFKNGKRYKIIVGTSEEFMWKLLDVMNRISQAVSNMTEGLSEESLKDDYDIEYDEMSNEDTGVSDEEIDIASIISEEAHYSPPKSDILFDIRIARVSPVSLVISFKRTPVASRYRKVMNTRGAKLMNYFTQSLKFTVDKANIKFSGYIEKHIKGPPDRLKELIIAEYTRRMKSQVLALMKATSIQDWKNLTGREEGDDEYAEGDILRSAGHLTGKSANFVLKSATSGISDGINTFTGAIGSGVMNATNALGVGEVGRGVNSVVTGLGGGIGSTVVGVGAGAGKVFRGTGTGIGQVFGGIGGGVVKAAKGIQQGVTDGDGTAVIDGFGDGASTVGKGLKNGAVSVATGIGDGLTAGGKGIFKGVKMIGKGLRQASFRSSSNKSEDSDNE